MSIYYCECLNALVGRKVIVHSCRSKYLVVVCNISPSLLEAIEVGSGCKKLFNLDRIDYIEEICC